MQQLASGDLSSKLEVKSSLAEIKVLSRAVNDMIHGVSGLIASVS
ncbi:HAMP domain-containing protein [Acetomicrobium sp. S15 = DSM 107314]